MKKKKAVRKKNPQSAVKGQPDRFYFNIQKVMKLFFQKMDVKGADKVPARGPAVFAGNHLGSIGPVVVMTNLPVKFNPWIIADMTDPDRCPDYLRKDFVEKDMGMKPPVSLVVSRVLAQLVVPLIQSMGAIPVYRRSRQIHDTLDRSIALLKKKKFLLLFPEDPDSRPRGDIRPFFRGYIKLGELYYQARKDKLCFYPLAVNQAKGFISIGDPVAYEPGNSFNREKKRLGEELEKRIRALYDGE